MEHAQVQAKLAGVVGQALQRGPEEISLEAAFEEDLGVGSLAMVEVLMALEDAFGIEITDAEAAGIFRVRDALDLVARKVAG